MGYIARQLTPRRIIHRQKSPFAGRRRLEIAAVACSFANSIDVAISRLKECSIVTLGLLHSWICLKSPLSILKFSREWEKFYVIGLVDPIVFTNVSYNRRCSCNNCIKMRKYFPHFFNRFRMNFLFLIIQECYCFVSLLMQYNFAIDLIAVVMIKTTFYSCRSEPFKHSMNANEWRNWCNPRVLL